MANTNNKLNAEKSAPNQNAAEALPVPAIDAEKVKKLTRGELIGNIATIFCAVALVYFAIGFAVGWTYELYALKLSTLIVAPVLIVAAAGAAAYCNIKFGNATEKIINDYVRDVLIHNAALIHPERDSLTFFCRLNDDSAEIKVNSYKEKIVFDFSAFGKLSPMRKTTVASAITNRLCVTFCRLVIERGAKYLSVNYTARTEKKNSKVAYIIKNGEPDKKAAKIYYKNK